MAELYTFSVKDQDQIRDDLLRTKRLGLLRLGIAAPNVTPDSDDYVQAQAFANELAVVQANTVIKADENMPDTALGDALARQGKPYGIFFRPATGSTGFVVAKSTQISSATAGDTLTDGAGLKYEVTVSGPYGNGSLIPVRALSAGAATNLAADTPIQWDSAPAYFDSKALVAPGGLINGVDLEDNETFRARLFAVLQNPPASGNEQHVAMIAEESSPSVQKAFPYPAIQGAGTVHIAVTAAPTATNKSRVIAGVTMTGTVIPYIVGQLPAHVAVTTTTVADVPTDLSIGLSLPASRAASPRGPGGGWLDSSPWPSVDGVGTFRVEVSAVTSTTVFEVDAFVEPSDGVSRIAWLSPTEWKLYLGTVISHTGTNGAWTITIDRPFVGIAIGNFIFPQSANQLTYVASILAHFQLMGPGEKSASVSALIRGFRRPPPALSWPSSLNSTALKSVEDSGDEVLAASYLYKSVTTPPVPGSITDPPNQLIPNNIAFYPTP